MTERAGENRMRRIADVSSRPLTYDSGTLALCNEPEFNGFLAALKDERVARAFAALPACSGEFIERA